MPRATLIVLVLAVGCSGGDAGSLITGVVSYASQPLNRGVVNFVAEGQRPLGGAIGPDGRYECRLLSGTYKVSVTVGLELPEGYQEGQPIPEQSLTLPEKYANPRTSGIVLQVSGPHEFDIELER